MLKNSCLLIVMLLLVIFMTGNAYALTLGNEITIFDGRSNSNYQGEDRETEPGMVNNQYWDMEGFFLNGTTLTMVGGFDFINGVDNYTQYSSGDIFISIDNTPAYGDYNPNNLGENDFYGYEYVLDLDFTGNTYTYDVIFLDSTAALEDVLLSDNDPYSNPWKYVSGGRAILEDQVLTYTGYGNSDLTDAATGFTGNDYRNAVSVDLAFLGSDVDFISHFTMGCGNDNLMGSGTTSVPEPATMLLLGTGLLGITGLRRKLKNK